MDRRGIAGRRCKGPSIHVSNCESRDPCARCEEGTQTPYAGVQQKPKTTSSKRVSPEPVSSQKSLSDTVVPKANEGDPLHPLDKAHRFSAHDRHGNVEVADKGVNGKRSNHNGDQKYNTPPVGCRVDYEEAADGTCSCFLCSHVIFMIPARKTCCILDNIPRILDELRIWWVKMIAIIKEKATRRRRKSLPCNTQGSVSQRSPLEVLTHPKAESKTLKVPGERVALLQSQGSFREGSLTAVNLLVKGEELQFSGYDLQLKAWRRGRMISCLPRPDKNLFKEYTVCGHGGLMVANVSKLAHKEEVVVFNLLTDERMVLPSLHHPRNPVLLHIWVDSVTASYVVIAAGNSSSSDDERLSRRIEVFDSRTSEWKVASDIPGPEYGLNEHQAGVCVDGILYFLAFLDCDGRKGILAFDVTKGAWLEDKTCSIPFSSSSHILQLVESHGTVYLYSQQEHGNVVEDCIDVLTLNGDGERQLRNVIRVQKCGSRGLLLFPEYICVPHGKGKLCVFNTINRDGVVYDMEKGIQIDVLQPPPESHRGENFFCLNPVSFSLELDFASKP